MTRHLKIGPLIARFAVNDADILACQSLRHFAFFGTQGIDSDRFDADFDHVLIENDAGTLLATMRLRVLQTQDQIAKTYTGQFYRITGLEGPLIELGRFCLREDGGSADVLRMAWAFLTAQVDRTGAKWLFGCSSFAGMQPDDHAAAFRILADRFQIDHNIQIDPQDVEFVSLSSAGGDVRGGISGMPTLLRSYLSLGGKTGGHAVVDADMGTLHVCTLLEIAAVPAARADRLRALAKNSGLHQDTAGNS